uniref:Uncharacterized protein n=1 Tax=Romanomermis culicivorax TaxID=13658 RepID=A0A915JDB1_ROMCU
MNIAPRVYTDFNEYVDRRPETDEEYYWLIMTSREPKLFYLIVDPAPSAGSIFKFLPSKTIENEPSQR